MSERLLRILHLEDSSRDAELVGDLLEADGIKATIIVAADRHAFAAQLDRAGFDVVLCDHNIPGYDGLSALKQAKGRQPDVPVLIVSGSIGEEEAVRCLQAGAADYLLKDRLQRLGPAVKRAVEAAETVRARAALEASHQETELRFRQFVEQTDDVFWYMGLHPERILYVSPAIETLWGSPAEAHYLDSRLWTDAIRRDDRARVEESFERFLAGTAPAFAEEFRVVRPDGTERHVADRGTLIRDEHGHVVGASGIARDVTERKQLEEQFLQAQKMEAVGRLAGGIAHDFNNVLTAIGGFTDLVIEQLGHDHPCHADLFEVRKATENATRLTRQLLAFSRKQILRPAIVDLDATIHHNLQILRRLVGNDVKVIVRAAGSPALIKVDPSQVEQILMNLAVNARDAMVDGGTLTIETCEDVLETGNAADESDLAPGRYVTMTVTDTGCGIPQHVLGRIFEPLFTTKSPDKGTGLGLSTVWGIVKQSGGAIRAASRVGQGTVFKICFPAASDSQSVDAEPDQAPGKARTAGETVLVVDDQDAVRRLVSRALERAGYRVLTARPSEARQVAEHHEGLLHLLITDLNMPGTNGAELAETLMTLRPELRVLYISGSADDTIVRVTSRSGFPSFLDKPFSPTGLLQAVTRVLQRDPGQRVF